MIWYFVAYYIMGVICSISLFIIEENHGRYLTLRDLLLSVFILWVIAPVCVVGSGLTWICSNANHIRIWEKK